MKKNFFFIHIRKIKANELAFAGVSGAWCGENLATAEPDFRPSAFYVLISGTQFLYMV